MGRATVVSGGTLGSYQVRLDYGKALRDARVAKIDARVAALGPEITAAQAAVDAHAASLVELRAAVDAAIVAFEAASWAVPRVAATLEAALAQYTKAQTVLIEAQQKGAPLRLALDALKEEKAQLLRDRAYWVALVLEETVQAWCADLTEDATGAVATIEIPGENKKVLIAPAAPAPVADDGALLAREVASPAQCFFNAAILPGWQKHMPTYRRGTITAVNFASDKATVTLEPTDKSSAQKLNINQTETLTDVPVEYMTCNATAFEVGDKCVIKFKERDWAQPRVVGFVDNPRPCAMVLSGVVKGGTVVAQALRSYRPTANAWQYVLREDPTRSPSDFNDEPRLGKAGTQYADIAPSQYSGKMAQVVQIVMGQGLAVNYGSTWARCHGVITAGDGKPWLVEISAANGVLAMRLPLARAPVTTSVDAVTQAVAAFGGIPNGVAMPTGAALTAAITAGTVRRLLTVGAMAAVFGKNTYSAAMGWTFNDAGSEAHNTCWYVNGSGQTMGCHYKLNLTESTASLELVSEGRLVKRADTEYVLPGVFGGYARLYPENSPWSFDGGETALPRDTVDGNASPSIDTTVFVFHQAGVLRKVNLRMEPFVLEDPNASFEANHDSLTAHHSWVETDAFALSRAAPFFRSYVFSDAYDGAASIYNPADPDSPVVLPWVWRTRSYTSVLNTWGVLFGTMAVGTRDGAIFYSEDSTNTTVVGEFITINTGVPSNPLGYLPFMDTLDVDGVTHIPGAEILRPGPDVSDETVTSTPAKVYVVTRIGMQTLAQPEDDRSYGYAYWNNPTKLTTCVLRYSAFGPTAHSLHTLPRLSGVGEIEISGASMSGETTPTATLYNFVGYL